MEYENKDYISSEKIAYFLNISKNILDAIPFCKKAPSSLHPPHLLNDNNNPLHRIHLADKNLSLIKPRLFPFHCFSGFLYSCTSYVHTDRYGKYISEKTGKSFKS